MQAHSPLSLTKQIKDIPDAVPAVAMQISAAAAATFQPRKTLTHTHGLTTFA